MKRVRQSGFSLIEVLFSVAIFAVFSSAVIGILLQTLSYERRNAEFAIATAYAREGVEMARLLLRDRFSEIGTVSGEGIQFSEGAVVLGGGGDYFDKYSRTITIEDAYRENGAIVESGDTSDEKTKKVTVTVNWDTFYGDSENIRFSTFITYWDESL